MSQPPSSRRHGVRGLAISALALLTVLGVVVAAVVWWNGGVGRIIGREQCTVSVGGDQVTLAPEQARNASTITLEAARRGLPQRAVTVALATAYQESDLINLPHGDRDSAGLFQQRPSQGWGSFDQITDPRYAASRFFDALVQIPDWQHLAITRAAQAVQRSAFPDAYQQHADKARLLSSAFTGDAQAAVSCTVRAETESSQPKQDDGLTQRASRLRDAVSAAFNQLPSGEFAGINRTQVAVHNRGRAIDIYLHSTDERGQRRQGWALAHWLVANADLFDVADVTFDDHTWSAAESPQGWRVDPAPSNESPGQRNLDHVRVDVV